MQRTTLTLAAALLAAVVVPAPALAQATDPADSTVTVPTTAPPAAPVPPIPATPAAPVGPDAAPTTLPPVPMAPTSSPTTPAVGPTAGPEAATEAAAPKVRGVGDSVFRSAESRVVNRLQPRYRPRFRSVLGGTIAAMTPPAREMMRTARPAVMVMGLGNPDMAETDAGLDPYTPATKLLRATTGIPCVVWVNVKQRGVNAFYNPQWRQHATAFNRWLVRASQRNVGTLYFANLHVLDWNQAAARHPGWFLEDGLHLNATGQANYARKVARFVNRVCPP